MRSKSEIFTGFAVMVSDWALMASAYAMGTSLSGGRMLEISVWPWIACLIVIYIVNVLASTRDLAENTILAFNISAAAVLTVVGTVFWAEAEGFINYLFIVFFFLISGIRSGYLAANKTHPNHVLIYTEVCIIILAVMLWLQGVMPEISKYHVIIFSALCADLIALILNRLVTENSVKISGSRFQGIFVLGSFFVIIAALSIGIMSLISETVKDAFGRTIEMIINGLSMIVYQIFRGILFIFSLIPHLESSRTNMIVQEGETLAGGAEQGPLDMDYLLPAFLIILAIAAVLILVYTFIKSRKIKVSGRKISLRTERKKVSVKSNLRDWIKNVIGKIKNSIIFNINFLKYKNTPQGLFVMIEKYGRQNNIIKSSGETPGAYVKRVGKNLTERNVLENTDSFFSLADTLDRLFYSEISDGIFNNLITKEELSAIKKSISN